MKAYLNRSIINFIEWHGSAGYIQRYEEFIKSYEKHSFEYTTAGGWILRYPTTYKTLHVGDVIIVGYKNLLVMSNEEFNKDYTEI